MKWPPPDEVLQGEIVHLEPIAEHHRDPLFLISGDEEIWQWTDRRVPRDRRHFDAWFDERILAKHQRTEWAYVTYSVAERRAVGSSSYLNVRAAHNGLEIGWTWLEPAVWRSGANLEAKLLMLRQAFKGLGCMRVELKTDARNWRSRDAISALGAKEEGIFRKHMLMPEIGERDTVFFSILDAEWPEVEDRLISRLSGNRRES